MDHLEQARGGSLTADECIVVSECYLNLWARCSPFFVAGLVMMMMYARREKDGEKPWERKNHS